MFKIIPPFLAGLLYLIFSYNVQAQYATEQALLKAFELHINTTQVNNTQKVKKLQHLLDVATKNNWQESWVEIQLSKAITYSELYEFGTLKNIIQETLPVAKQLQLSDEIVVLETLWLDASRDSSAFTNIFSAEELHSKLAKMKNEELKDEVRGLLAHYFYKQDDLLTSLHLALDLNDHTDTLKVRKADHLSSIYYRVGDIEKYNKYANETLALSENLNPSIKVFIMYNRLRDLFVQGDFIEINQYLPKFEKTVILTGDVTLLADVYRYKGMLALHQHDLPLAKSFLNKSISIYQANDLDSYVMASNLVLLKVLLSEGDFSAAKEKLLDIEPTVVLYAEPLHFSEYYQIATTVYKSLNDYKSAFMAAENLKKHELILLKSNNQTKVIKFEYQQNLKDQALKKAYLQAEQKQKNIIWLLMMSVGLLVLCFLIFVLYKQMSDKQKLNVLVNTDVLTGAPNRRAILKIADQQLLYCQEKKLPLTIILADLDLFKSINDEFGHDIGDEVLKVFSDCSERAIRQSEFYGRFGGEEWLFVLPQTKVIFAQTLFQRLNQEIAKNEQQLPFNSKRLTFSMGATEFEQGDTIKSMIYRADKLLYQAKDKGRNCLCS